MSTSATISYLNLHSTVFNNLSFGVRQFQQLPIHTPSIDYFQQLCDHLQCNGKVTLLKRHHFEVLRHFQSFCLGYFIKPSIVVRGREILGHWQIKQSKQGPELMCWKENICEGRRSKASVINLCHEIRSPDMGRGHSMPSQN